MYLIAFFAFVFAAALGLTMAVRHSRGLDSGRALGIAHGLFAISGIVLLAVGLASVQAGLGWWILVLFLLVAAGGAYLFVRQAKGEPWPGLVIVAHGGLALATIVLLGVWLANRPTPPSVDGDVPSQRTGAEPRGAL
jgi:hypothetical protein